MGGNNQGCSWVMVRPAGHVRRYKKKTHGSSRVGSGREVFEISRVGSGRVGSGRVGSGQEVFNVTVRAGST